MHNEIVLYLSQKVHACLLRT